MSDEGDKQSGSGEMRLQPCTWPFSRARNRDANNCAKKFTQRPKSGARLASTQRPAQAQHTVGRRKAGSPTMQRYQKLGTTTDVLTGTLAVLYSYTIGPNPVTSRRLGAAGHPTVCQTQDLNCWSESCGGIGDYPRR